jgi:CDP-diacylglycerol---serine O-phosphatidyltransferase
MITRIKPAIPHIFTLTNLLFGTLGIFHAFDRNWGGVLLMLCGSLLMDVFDGWAARLLNVTSDLGKQLDSLADMVSFGVLPGITLFWLMRDQCEPLSLVQQSVPLGAFAITLCTALRLGKFNIDTRQGNYFIGLAVPSQAIAIIGLSFWSEEIGNIWEYWQINPALIYLLIAIIFCWAMLTNKIALPALKSWSLPGTKFTFIALSVSGIVLFYFLGLKSLSVIILLYLIFGSVFFRPEKASKQP